LVDKSLISAEEGEEETRFRMLETIRQYAWEKLWEADQGARIRRRHRDWCLGLAEGALGELEGAERTAGMGRLVREYENLQAALGWPFPRRALRSVYAASDLALGAERLERWNGIIEKLVPAYRHLGRAEAARVLLEEYIALCEAEGYWLGLARASTLLAVSLILYGRRTEADARFDTAITVCEAHGLHDWAVYPRTRLAERLAIEGRELERAEALVRDCPPEAETCHDVPWLAGQRLILGPRIYTTQMWIATHGQDWEGLKRAFQASLAWGGPYGISLRLMLDKIEEICHQRREERIFHDLCHFMAQGYARAGLAVPLQQWCLEPARPRIPLGERWMEERFEAEEWHPALRWHDPTGRSRIDRLTRPGWLGVTPEEGTNLWPETDLNAPRLVAEAWGDFVAQTRVELDPGTYVQAGLLLWGGEAQFARLELQSRPQDPERASVQFAACVAGRFQHVGRGQCEQRAMWLRFERVGEELVGLCSGDGEEWLTCGRVSLPRTAVEGCATSPPSEHANGSDPRGESVGEQVGIAAIPYRPSGECAWFDTFELWRIGQ
jgi:hypothetical protein